ncbi:hypothetical protein [Streptomyces sp. NPDC051219]|uniref:hypothetical protein n=1 Tax=Streptomyces sp. NPDC051219 TaxID=3155283 RepID=UPI003412D56C
MHFGFADGFAVESIPRGLHLVPRYSVGGHFVVVSPYFDRHSRESFLGATFGSMDWLTEDDDEFRFDKRTRELAGVMVAVPQEADAEWDGGAWLRLPREAAGVRAAAAENFSARPTTVRWVEHGATALVCAYPEFTRDARGLRRLGVAPGFDLVAGDRGYAGWILENPADCVVDAFEPAPQGPAPEGFREALAEFLDLFVEPRIEQMQDEDPGLKVRLDGLLERASSLDPDPRRDALREWLLQVREDWYGIPA